MLAAAGCRKATPEKIESDVENVCRYARFAIVLKEGVPHLIDNGQLFRSDKPFARIIVVVGPLYQKGERSHEPTETVLLEIGYSRTRPYSRVEYHYKQSNGERQRNGRWYLKERTRVRGISDSELQTIYPVIEQCMAAIVLECREHWKHKERWWVSGPGLVDRGIYFTIDKSDHTLYRQVLLEDIRFRKDEYIHGHARRIRRLVGHYRYPDYSRQQLERFSGVGKVVELLREQTYDDPFYRRVLLECFKPGSHIREILERMNRFFDLQMMNSCDEYARVVYEEDGLKLPLWQAVRARLVQQPMWHAKNGLVFETILERRYREIHECPF